MGRPICAAATLLPVTMPLLFFALAATLFLSWLLSASVSKLVEVPPLMRLVAVPTAGY
jgi:hypothetical protein